ncbi:MAG: hypothetical protein FJZ95_02745 [Chloroflexi bacterium]|nr:hypothetical protein [Chloroflexota bacterium]
MTKKAWLFGLVCVMVGGLMLAGIGTAAGDAPPTPSPPVISGDFGDAPDNTDDPTIEAYPGVPGRFPTLLNTTNALIPGNTGPYHENVQPLWLGVFVNTATGEYNAKLVDMDNDDALVGIVDIGGGSYVLRIRSLHLAADAGYMEGGFVNAWVDKNKDGMWDRSERVIANEFVVIPPGGGRDLDSSPFTMPDKTDKWARATLTRWPLDLSLTWDGSIPQWGLEYGETEDRLARLMVPWEQPGGGIIEGVGIGSGSHAAPWPLITGGALALIAVLLASGWYARKHWAVRREP